jgi:hypothetical protein
MQEHPVLIDSHNQIRTFEKTIFDFFREMIDSKLVATKYIINQNDWGDIVQYSDSIVYDDLK